MPYVTTGEWNQLLRTLLAQRLELNAIESGLKNAQVLTDAQVQEIRQQAAETAVAWSSKDGDDVLRLLRVHSSPKASMLVPPTRKDGEGR